MSQATLARQLGISETQVSDWARGKHRPSRATRNAIAGILGVRTEWLTSGEGEIYKEGGGVPPYNKDVGGSPPVVVEAHDESLTEKRARLVAELRKFAERIDESDADALLLVIQKITREKKEETK